MIRRALLAALLLLAACNGPGHIAYDKDHCLIDGQPATLMQVEARQAAVAQRIQSRQPWFAAITILVVMLAAASNAEKAMAIVRARRQDHQKPLGERLREALERTRQSPLRFFAIVSGTLLLLLAAGGTYIFLDVDKRASERALQMLQFCHLALRTSEEQGVLDEQKRNLASIQSTAGDIRALVDKLPPEEKQKAREIVATMNSALDKQGKIVGDYLAKSDEEARSMREHTALVEKGLTSLSSDLTALKSVPAGLLHLDDALKHADQRLDAHDAKVAAEAAKLQAQLAAVDAKLQQLLARPVCEPPPREPPATAPKKEAAPASAPKTQPDGGAAKT